MAVTSTSLNLARKCLAGPKVAARSMADFELMLVTLVTLDIVQASLAQLRTPCIELACTSARLVNPLGNEVSGLVLEDWRGIGADRSVHGGIHDPHWFLLLAASVARIFRVPQLFFLMMILFLQICVSSVDPLAFPSAVEAGAQMVEIGNYDSFYEMGIQFSPEQILKLTRETRRILPSITLSVTVPHMLSLPDQVKLAELLEQEGADIIQTEGGKYSSPSKPGVLGLIEKVTTATPTLAAAYSISRAVQIPVMCSSGLSAVTAPMALTAGAAGVLNTNTWTSTFLSWLDLKKQFHAMDTNNSG
ncbi:hypothetical protein ZIOFF_061946 [Zingiber officinale]|uniref:Uncharacterized protein ycf23 n=2 Tax=Zingiber officinale TaxID=94328 RepID=A0A8J5F034_ZINOF|nr:hypothetical protein ZIOFF_061946 [Zingiber officinale]